VTDHAWKAFERRVARLLGTNRIPVTGERHGADAETELFAFQFKKRKAFPGYVATWLDQIRGSRPSKTGVVVMQRPRRDDLDALVVVTLRDWLELHGPTIHFEWKVEQPEAGTTV